MRNKLKQTKKSIVQRDQMSIKFKTQLIDLKW